MTPRLRPSPELCTPFRDPLHSTDQRSPRTPFLDELLGCLFLVIEIVLMDARISLKQTDMAILRELSFGAEHFPLAKSAIDVQNRRDTKKPGDEPGLVWSG